MSKHFPTSVDGLAVLRLRVLSMLAVVALVIVPCVQGQTATATGRLQATGVVRAMDVYIRSGPSLNHYTVTKLQAGDKVEIVGESGDWFEINPPSGVFSLISGDYVDTSDMRDGVVNGDQVRVRAGSDLTDSKYTIQLKLSRGAEVRIIEEQPDGFLKIVPPAGATVWINRAYVDVVQGDGASDAARLNRIFDEPADDGPAGYSAPATGREAGEVQAVPSNAVPSNAVPSNNGGTSEGSLAEQYIRGKGTPPASRPVDDGQAYSSGRSSDAMNTTMPPGGAAAADSSSEVAGDGGRSATEDEYPSTFQSWSTRSETSSENHSSTERSWQASGDTPVTSGSPTDAASASGSGAGGDEPWAQSSWDLPPADQTSSSLSGDTGRPYSNNPGEVTSPSGVITPAPGSRQQADSSTAGFSRSADGLAHRPVDPSQVNGASGWTAGSAGHADRGGMPQGTLPESRPAPPPAVRAQIPPGADDLTALEAIDEVMRDQLRLTVEQRNLDGVISQYEMIRSRTADEVSRQYADGRVRQLERVRENDTVVRRLLEMERQARAARSQVNVQPTMASGVVPVEAPRFDIRGELQVSGVYTGEVGPVRYRLVDPDGPLRRTLAYVEIDPEAPLNLHQFLGRQVGIVAKERKYLDGGVDAVPVFVVADVRVLDTTEDQRYQGEVSAGSPAPEPVRPMRQMRRMEAVPGSASQMTENRR